MPPAVDRRDFLARTGRLAAGAALLSAGFAPDAAARRRRGPNERLAIGLIGCGSLGRDHHLANLLRRDDVDVVAVCDVDAEHLGRAAAIAGGRAKALDDHRRVLDRPDVDAVLIATPDHWHAIPAIDACRAGKDVYCEKPLSLTIAEGRAMADAARRYGTVFQTGSQQRSSELFHHACDLVRNGRIGRLRSITAAIGRGPTCDLEPDRTPPSHLDWDAWLGPAPLVPYTPKRCHYTFRWFSDTSGGKVTDWGAHHLDVAQWANGSSLSGPVAVEGRATFPERGLYDTPVTFDVRFRYENGVDLLLTSEGENGVTLRGDDGEIFVSRSRIAATPRDVLAQDVDAGPVRLARSRNHWSNWIDAIRDRSRPICDVEIGHRSATVCHLANIAVRLGRPLRWDPSSERFPDDEEANRMTMRPMRLPYAL